MKTGKKRLVTLLAVLLTLSLLLCAVPAILAAEETASGTCGENLTWTLADGVLTISGEGEMNSYEHGEAPWWSYSDQITSAVIEDGVTSIGSYAFSDTRLTTVYIPKAVTNIGSSAFYGCGSLAEITVAPENATYASVDGVLYNGDVTELIYCPEGKIGVMDIPEGVTSIGNATFHGCYRLTSIKIPRSVTSIGGHAFYSCTSLAEITVTSENAYYASEDGILYSKDMTALICCPTRKTGTVDIPDGVTSIDDYAFYGCKDLTDVSIPEGVTYIGNYAFCLCESLTGTTIPNSVTSIGDYAFSDCTSLAGSITIPDGVISIGPSTFSGCSSLSSIELPTSLTSIGSSAFYYCTSLTSIKLPESLTSIGDHAFFWCSNLTNITIPDNVTSIGFYAFGYSGLTSITIPKSVTDIGFGAFAECSNLTDVYYGGSEEEWAAITIGSSNDKLLNATIHYNSNSQKEPSIIIEGTDESYTLGSEDAAVIHCSGALADFVSVSMDGAVVSDDNYDLAEGSTILTFKASYLETLSVGKHTVTLTYTTGSVETTLTVLERASTNPETTEPETTEPEATDPGTTESDGVADETNPKDGDSAVLLLPAGLMLACALSLLCLNRKKRMH